MAFWCDWGLSALLATIILLSISDGHSVDGFVRCRPIVEKNRRRSSSRLQGQQSNAHSSKWDEAVKLLESTVSCRRCFDHRAHKARLLGLYSGESQELLIAVQPDRSCGRKLIFLDFNSSGSIVGYVLLESQPKEPIDGSDQIETNPYLPSSKLRGMCVDDASRGKGYSGLFLAIWMRLCLEAKVVPTTCRIRKPLLALTLLRFGFTPSDSSDKANIVSVSPRSEDGNVVVYASLAGFSKTERRSQRLVPTHVNDQSSNGPNKEVHIRTPYDFGSGVKGLNAATAMLGNGLRFGATAPISVRDKEMVLQALYGRI